MLEANGGLFPRVFAVLTLSTRAPSFLGSTLLGKGRSVTSSAVSTERPLPTSGSASGAKVFAGVSKSGTILSTSFAAESNVSTLSSVPDYGRFYSAPGAFTVSLVLHNYEISPFSVLTASYYRDPVFSTD